MISDDTKFKLELMLYTRIDRDYVRTLAHELIDSGTWIDDFDLVIGLEAADSENIDIVFRRICDQYHIVKRPIEGFVERAKFYYSKKIIEAKKDHPNVMEAVYAMVHLIQYDLDFQSRDKKVAGESAGIVDFVGPYYEYEEYDCYQLSDTQKQQAKDDDIDQVTKAANQTVQATGANAPVA